MAPPYQAPRPARACPVGRRSIAEPALHRQRSLRPLILSGPHPCYPLLSTRRTKHSFLSLVAPPLRTVTDFIRCRPCRDPVNPPLPCACPLL